MLDVDRGGITTYVVIKNAHHSISRGELEFSKYRGKIRHFLSWDFWMFQNLS